MHVKTSILPLALGATMLLSALAVSEPLPGDGKGGGRLSACRADLATFCKDVDAGGGRKIQCLARHRDKLSPECVAVVDARMGGARSDGTAGPTPAPAAPTVAPRAKRVAGPPLRLRRACAVDLATHCQETAKGAGRRMACLQKMLPQLTPECSSALTEAMERRKSMRIACAGDRKSLCADRKGAEAMACLRSNRERLSVRCAELLPMPGRRKPGEGAGPQK